MVCGYGHLVVVELLIRRYLLGRRHSYHVNAVRSGIQMAARQCQLDVLKLLQSLGYTVSNSSWKLLRSHSNRQDVVLYLKSMGKYT